MLNPDPKHPGTILADRFLEPARLAPTALAIEIRVPPSRMTETANGKRNVSLDTAFRLARFFGNRVEDWLMWQMEWEIAQARKAGIEARVNEDVRPRSARREAA